MGPPDKLALPDRRGVRENLAALAIREQWALLAIEVQLQQSQDRRGLLALPGRPRLPWAFWVNRCNWKDRGDGCDRDDGRYGKHRSHGSHGSHRKPWSGVDNPWAYWNDWRHWKRLGGYRAHRSDWCARCKFYGDGSDRSYG